MKNHFGPEDIAPNSLIGKKKIDVEVNHFFSLYVMRLKKVC